MCLRAVWHQKKERNKMAQSALAKKFMKQMKKKPKPKSESDKKFEAAIKELNEKIKVLRERKKNQVTKGSK